MSSALTHISAQAASATSQHWNLWMPRSLRGNGLGLGLYKTITSKTSGFGCGCTTKIWTNMRYASTAQKSMSFCWPLSSNPSWMTLSRVPGLSFSSLLEQKESGKKDHHAPESKSTMPQLIFLRACWNDHDLEEGDMVKTILDQQDMQDQALDLFGSNEALEFYDGEDWTLLTAESMDMIQDLVSNHQKKSAKAYTLPIRVPSLYDEDYGTENDLVKVRKLTPEDMLKQQELEKSRPTMPQTQMKMAITSLHHTLVREGYTRHTEEGSSSNGTVELEGLRDASPTEPNHPEELQQQGMVTDVDGITMSTRDWVLEEANRRYDDGSLRSVLLSQPRALRHISEALHYNFLD